MITADEATLNRLAAAVQHNCDIADARHARDYTLCIYLLKMRELYRWERRLPYGASLPKDDLGRWLTQREARWEGLEEREFAPVDVDGLSFAPFDDLAANSALAALGLVYSGGYGAAGRPHFFLGELETSHRDGEHTVLVAGREYARDLTAPPAMSRGDTVFVRQESLRRAIWEKVEEWQWQKRAESPMAAVVAHYGFAEDVDQALDRATRAETDSVVLHELGEVRAGLLLGDTWGTMVASLAHTRAEHITRAVRDHLADCLVTLPTLLERENVASLHFYFANFSGMRRETFPQLLAAYRQWTETGRWGGLVSAVDAGRPYFERVARDLLALEHRGARTTLLAVEPAEIAL